MDKRQEFVSFMQRYNMLNPIITFDGDYTFQSLKDNKYDQNHDILVLNSKLDSKGNNMYLELVKRHFNDAINFGIVEELSSGIIFPLLVSSLSDDGKNRVLRFNTAITIMNLVEDMKSLDDITDVPKMCDNLRDWYRNERIKTKDFKEKRINSEYAKDVMARYISAKTGTQVRPEDLTQELIEKTNKVLDDEWLDRHIVKFSQVSGVVRRIKEYSESNHTISLEEFSNCFEPETLFLVIAKSILDNQGSSIRLHGSPDSAFIIVTQYVNDLKRLGFKNYDYSIKTYDYGSRTIRKFSAKELICAHDRIQEKFKGVLSNYSLPEDQVLRLGLDHSIDAIQTFKKMINETDEKIIKTGWDIIPSGEREIERKEYTSSRSHDTYTSSDRKTIDSDDILYRKFAFQETPYLTQIVGKEKFTGYVGYIYENGLVIFEKFYEENGSICQSSATYVMNYKNFLEFTKLTKPEIIKYIKDTDNPDVARMLHNDTWRDRLHALIDSVEITLESQTFAEIMRNNEILGVARTKKNSDN